MTGRFELLRGVWGCGALNPATPLDYTLSENAMFVLRGVVSVSRLSS